MVKSIRFAVALLVVVSMVFGGGYAFASTAAQIDQSVKNALDDLYAKTSSAKALGEKAKGILVFPTIIKAGLIFGGQAGEGALLSGGKTLGYYNIIAGSYGWQAGVQTFGYVLFFMDDADLEYLYNSNGWEIGVGPNITVVEAGAAASLSTTTVNKGIYAFFFDQKGLMGGLGLEGSKISLINPPKK
ncbi:MAG TPA: YSC84-related protein [Candidatus Omnitrophota bacterium]|nr:YSC84-related protein [Candidatus Omnitrophota bacterium]HPS20501.1 YSC84-related protein [Candidatus Omnitrophota bacterium]